MRRNDTADDHDPSRNPALIGKGYVDDTNSSCDTRAFKEHAKVEREERLLVGSDRLQRERLQGDRGLSRIGREIARSIAACHGTDAPFVSA
jgi:hypothetical protein